MSSVLLPGSITILMTPRFTIGLSNVGMSLMTKMRLLRGAMLINSVVITPVIAYQFSRPRRLLATASPVGSPSC